MERLLAQTLAKTPKSILLLGPRQTGKSTLIESLDPDLVVNLARESEFLTFSANPAELEERLAAAHPKTVFIDEVQRLPSLLNTVQAILDQAKLNRRPLKFFLTGSSARKLRRGQANLLPGRVLTYGLGPLCAAELEYSLNVQRALVYGTLPEPYLERDDALAQKLLESYAGTYLKEEIQAEALSRNIQSFARFLTQAAAVSGQLLDFSKLAQRAKVSRSSAMRYFELLEDTLLVHRLPPFDAALDADLVKHARYYFFDAGVLNGLLGNFSASADRVGNLFEHVVVSQLHATAKALDVRMELFSFRTRGGLEVDLVAKINQRYFAVEAKAGSTPNTRDASALVQAKRYLPKGTKLFIVVPKGAARKLASDVTVLPLNDLLREVFNVTTALASPE